MVVGPAFKTVLLFKDHWLLIISVETRKGERVLGSFFFFKN
jgi:hypothetical protein